MSGIRSRIVCAATVVVALALGVLPGQACEEHHGPCPVAAGEPGRPQGHSRLNNKQAGDRIAEDPRSAPTSGRRAGDASEQQADSAGANPAEADGTRAAPRLSDFVSPRPFADDDAKDLQTPRIDASQFDASPGGTSAGRPKPLGAVSRPAAGSDDARRPVRQLDPEGDVTHSTFSPSSLLDAVIGTSFKDMPGSSWVELGFLAWGGLLTIATAIRMLVG